MLIKYVISLNMNQSSSLVDFIKNSLGQLAFGKGYTIFSEEISRLFSTDIIVAPSDDMQDTLFLMFDDEQAAKKFEESFDETGIIN